MRNTKELMRSLDVITQLLLLYFLYFFGLEQKLEGQKALLEWLPQKDSGWTYWEKMALMCEKSIFNPSSFTLPDHSLVDI